MQIRQIVKKSGGTRTIYIPSAKEKRKLRFLLPALHEAQKKTCSSNIVHGFFRGKNIVTNALQHVGFKYTTCFDLKDFFDSVDKEKIEQGLLSYDNNNDPQKAFEILSFADWMLVDGAPRQGLPTSPFLANIAASVLDREIIDFLDVIKRMSHIPPFLLEEGHAKIAYTRYADDLTFSYDYLDIQRELLERIPSITESCGFKINPSKTRTMSHKKGRIITGVAVDDGGVHIPRRVKRKLRAARHKGNVKSIIGFEEYSKLKLPRDIEHNVFETWKTLIISQTREKISARKFKPLSL